MFETVFQSSAPLGYLLKSSGHVRMDFKAIISFSASLTQCSFIAKMASYNHICIISSQKFWWQDGINHLTFELQPQNRTFSFFPCHWELACCSVESWRPSQGELMQTDFFSSSNSSCSPKNGENKLVLLWTSILFLIHQRMVAENSLLFHHKTKGLTNDPNDVKGRKDHPNHCCIFLIYI